MRTRRSLNDAIGVNRRPGRGISRRQLLRGLAAAATSLCAGCAPRAAQRFPAGPEVVQLVYQDWGTEWYPPMARRMLERFHEAHPHIQVFFTPDPIDLQGQMVADMQAGTAADVFQGCCTYFPSWAQLGYVLDLRSYVAQDLARETVDDWDLAQYRAFFTPGGMQFGLPKCYGSLGVYYNKDLLDTYGVNYPRHGWDHEAYAEAMLYATDDRSGDDVTDLWGSLLEVSWDRVQAHVNGWGGNLVDPEDPATLRMCEQPALDAIDWIRVQMWDVGAMAKPADVLFVPTSDAFISQQVAMVEDGSWALNRVLSSADFRIGIAPFPAGPVRRATLATSDGYGIYSGTLHPEEAWELVKFLTDREFGRAMIDANLLQPARSSLLEAWVEAVVSAHPDKIDVEDVAAFVDGREEGYSVTVEISDDMETVRALFDQALEEILVLGTEPVERMIRACQEIEREAK